MRDCIVVVLTAASVASAQGVLYESGGFVTHPGQGASGADVSQADAAFASLGDPMYFTLPGPWYRAASPFTVPTHGTPPAGGGERWWLERIRIYAFTETSGGVPPALPFTSASIWIWNADPRLPSSQIVASSGNVTAQWAGAYRVEPGQLLQDTRPIYSFDITFNFESLGSGEYWIETQVTGGSATTPYVMDGMLNAQGSAMVLGPQGWAPTTYSGRGVAHPFEIRGIREPIPNCYANCDLSTTPPILNVADFTCFLQQFALSISTAAMHQPGVYADCDSSHNCCFNIADFSCFLGKFAAGCP
jgi:hypothetical protein